MSSEISEYENRIRDFINSPRKHSQLLNNKGQWFQICSALDVIGDTELAINDYLEDIDNKSEYGELYFLLYGILQVLFVQRAAVVDLAKALEIDIEKKILENLDEMRNIRNSSIGHPTETNKNGKKSYNFIVRNSMTRSGFSLITYYKNSQSETNQVDLRKLFVIQRESVGRILEEIIHGLKLQELEHRKMYRDKKLSLEYPDILPYYFEKIENSILGDDYPGLGAGGAESVLKICQNIKNAFDERGLIDAYRLKEDFDLLEHALIRVKNFLANSGDYRMEKKDGYIYYSFVHKKMKDLKELAVRIDDEYASDQLV